MSGPIKFQKVASAVGAIFQAQYGLYTLDMDEGKTSLTISGDNEFAFFSLTESGEVVVISGDPVTQHWNSEDWNALKSAIAAAK